MLSSSVKHTSDRGWFDCCYCKYIFLNNQVPQCFMTCIISLFYSTIPDMKDTALSKIVFSLCVNIAVIQKQPYDALINSKSYNLQCTRKKRCISCTGVSDSESYFLQCAVSKSRFVIKTQTDLKHNA